MKDYAGRCAPSSGASAPRAHRNPGSPVYPQAPARDPAGDAEGSEGPVGHHPKPIPTNRHPIATPQARTHGHRQHWPRPAAPREPRAPHSMTRLTAQPAGPPPNSSGGLLLGRRLGPVPTTLPVTTGRCTQQPRPQAANQSAPPATTHLKPRRPSPAPTKRDYGEGTRPASDSAPCRRRNGPRPHWARQPGPASPWQ